MGVRTHPSAPLCTPDAPCRGCILHVLGRCYMKHSRDSTNLLWLRTLTQHALAILHAHRTHEKKSFNPRMTSSRASSSLPPLRWWFIMTRKCLPPQFVFPLFEARLEFSELSELAELHLECRCPELPMFNDATYCRFRQILYRKQFASHLR